MRYDKKEWIGHLIDSLVIRTEQPYNWIFARWRLTHDKTIIPSEISCTRNNGETREIFRVL